MCSIDKFALSLALERVAEAIDRLDADRWSADSSDLEARIAEIWAMVCEIDPQMSRLASRYADPSS
ncbi:MAG: hypothetical protein ABSB59_08410 [Streptosporangiaceae bacterium]